MDDTSSDEDEEEVEVESKLLELMLEFQSWADNDLPAGPVKLEAKRKATKVKP